MRARASLSQNRTEPRLLQRHDPTIGAQLDDVERSIDEHTASLLELPSVRPSASSPTYRLASMTNEPDPTSLQLAERTRRAGPRL